MTPPGRQPQSNVPEPPEPADYVPRPRPLDEERRLAEELVRRLEAAKAADPDGWTPEMQNALIGADNAEYWLIGLIGR